LNQLQRRGRIDSESVRKSRVQIRVAAGGQWESIDCCVAFCTERDKYEAGAEIGTGAKFKDSSTTWVEAAALPPLNDTQNVIDRALDVALSKRSRPPVTEQPMANHVRHAEPSASREPAGIPCYLSQGLHVEATAPQLPHSLNLMFRLATVGLLQAAGILPTCPRSVSFS
jgi:hypothetical protein